MFNVEKATAMAAFFLERAPRKRLNDLKLMKLLYMSERESLRLYTATITDSQFYSLMNGPVLSEVADLYKGREVLPFWADHIEFIHRDTGKVTHNTVALLEPVETERFLSRAEIKILEAIWKANKSKDKWDLVELTHAFPEWNKQAKIEGTSYRLTERDIFLLGFEEDPELVESKLADLEYFRNVAA